MPTSQPVLLLHRHERVKPVQQQLLSNLSLCPLTSSTRSASLGCPAHFLLPGRCPELAALLQVLALLQLLLPEVAAHHRVAVLVNAIGEVLAGHADHAFFPVLQFAVVDKIPLLHGTSLSTPALVGASCWRQLAQGHQWSRRMNMCS